VLNAAFRFDQEVARRHRMFEAAFAAGQDAAMFVI
jgi:hypothetical protein